MDIQTGDAASILATNPQTKPLHYHIIQYLAPWGPIWKFPENISITFSRITKYLKSSRKILKMVMNSDNVQKLFSKCLKKEYFKHFEKISGHYRYSSPFSIIRIWRKLFIFGKQNLLNTEQSLNQANIWNLSKIFRIWANFQKISLIHRNKIWSVRAMRIYQNVTYENLDKLPRNIKKCFQKCRKTFLKKISIKFWQYKFDFVE